MLLRECETPFVIVAGLSESGVWTFASGPRVQAQDASLHHRLSLEIVVGGIHRTPDSENPATFTMNDVRDVAPRLAFHRPSCIVMPGDIDSESVGRADAEVVLPAECESRSDIAYDG